MSHFRRIESRSARRIHFAFMGNNQEQFRSAILSFLTINPPRVKVRPLDGTAEGYDQTGNGDNE